MSATTRSMKVCFSGFMQDEKNALKRFAADAGMIPVGAVSKSLGYLVAGPYCEPKMRVHAAGFEIPILERDEFELLLSELAGKTEDAGGQQPSLAVGQKLSMPAGVFVAIDFETADRHRDSACAVGMVRIENGTVTAREYSLIRPPRAQVEFAHINGLDWSDLAGEKPFGEVWKALRGLYEGADYFIGHNAALQKSILTACCGEADIRPPATRFIDTLRGVRNEIPGASSYCLSAMCEVYGIPLNRHQAMSDAMAAALLFSKLHDAGVSCDSIAISGIQPADAAGGVPAIDAATSAALKEFLAIAKALVKDGILTEEEMAYVLEWMDENSRLEDSPYFSPLFELAWQIIEDDIMTDEELEEMEGMLERWIAAVGGRV